MTTDTSPPVKRDDVATLAAWRRDGAHRLDPVRFSFLEALARRAASLDGPARRLLDDKLAQGLAAYGEKVARRASQDVALPATPDAASPPAAGHQPAPAQSKKTGAPKASGAVHSPEPRGRLADIVDLLGHPGTSTRDNASPAATAPALAGLRTASLLTTAPPDLKTLSYFRSTWTRLSADQRLTHALEQVPENAGPLNSQHLVHRALATMRDTSPAYLQQFVSYVDALLWMDQAHSQAFVMPAREGKAEGVKKGGRRGS